MRVIYIITIISCFLGIYNSFIRNRYNKKITNRYYSLNTCFMDDEDDINKYNNMQNLLYEKIEFVNIDNKDDKSLYILIWYNCEECKKLLEDMESLNLKTLYINIDINMPLLYKDDEYISDDLFDIYKEIYKEI